MIISRKHFSIHLHLHETGSPVHRWDSLGQVSNRGIPCCFGMSDRRADLKVAGVAKRGLGSPHLELLHHHAHAGDIDNSIYIRRSLQCLLD